MPNLELYGFDRAAINGNASAFAKIKTVFANWPCASDMIVTIVSDSRALSLQGDPQPYIRVWDTDKEEGEKIALRLRLEGFEVELPPPLSRFLAKPLYTIEEMVSELRSIIRDREAYVDIVNLLLAGDVMSARTFFVAELAAEPYSSFLPPTAEELSIKHSAPRTNDYSSEALQARFVRWYQMLGILS